MKENTCQRVYNEKETCYPFKTRHKIVIFRQNIKIRSVVLNTVSNSRLDEHSFGGIIKTFYTVRGGRERRPSYGCAIEVYDMLKRV